MLRVDPRVGGGTYFTWNNLPRRVGLAGPCAYYQAFGRPGPQIDKWMRERGWTLAQRTQWNIPIPPRDAEGWPRMSGDSFPLRDAWRATNCSRRVCVARRGSGRV
jgi:hypothetical protein